MALGADELMEIEKMLSAAGSGEGVVTELRQRFPRLSWTPCDAADMTDEPFRTYAGFEIHLLDRSDHCVQITTDPARATGIVVATRSAA
ncbi:hypothetical protein [Bradyrhizobium sp.]|uniref:hypothetical protein n=1 Tax=Bradyrhizobium sp. TaxID=376 RepID=UPI004037C3B9